MVDWSDLRLSTVSSNWWKDICSLEKVVETKNWIVESLARKLDFGAGDVFGGGGLLDLETGSGWGLLG
ncbi:hypothetical protein A2U01_0047119 [Trifolium medium]|uniref:Uncharacterized protein n=1 Tax=Trifolium medium TaxID=97028 RepID=A0A392QNW6_9FABA|nr:hypothetical protein [Trifolium medium]